MHTFHFYCSHINSLHTVCYYTKYCIFLIENRKMKSFGLHIILMFMPVYLWMKHQISEEHQAKIWLVMCRYTYCYLYQMFIQYFYYVVSNNSLVRSHLILHISRLRHYNSAQYTLTKSVVGPFCGSEIISLLTLCL